MGHTAGLLGAGLSLLGFGLAMGLNPALYAATVDMLARAKNPGRRLTLMIAGLFTGATALFFALQGLNPDHLVKVVETDLDKAVMDRLVDAVAGGVFIGAGLVLAAWRVHEPQLKQKAPKKPKENAGIWSYFVLGLGASVIGFTTLPIMYLVGRVIAAATHALALKAALYALFLVALAAPFLLLAFAWSRFLKFTDAFSRYYARLLKFDYRTIAAVLSVLVGAALIVGGLIGW